MSNKPCMDAKTNQQIEESSVFDSVKLQIPSVASESSSSDSEDEISIFRRPPGFALPEDTDIDVECLLLEDSETEDLPESVTPPSNCWTDETFSEQRVDCNPQSSLKLGYLGNAVTGQRCDDMKNHRLSHDQSKMSEIENYIQTHDQNKTDSSDVNSAVRYHTSETAKSVGKMVGEQSLPVPVLTLKHIDNWDLDQVLRTLQHDVEPIKCTEEGEPMQPLPVTAKGYNSLKSDDNIMEQLATFCKKQVCEVAELKVNSESGSVFNSLQGSLKKHPACPRNMYDGECAKTYCHLAPGLPQNQQDFPTIHIDLRHPEIKMDNTVLRDSSTIPEHQDNPKEQGEILSTEKMQSEKNTKGKREVTGKSMLLQKLREAHQNRTAGSCPVKEPVRRAPAVSVVERKCEKASQSKNYRNGHPEKSCEEQTHQVKNANSLTAKPDQPTPDSHKKSARQLSKNQRDGVQRSLQKNSTQHEQLLKQLLARRPQWSECGRQPAAENTDVLYDTEASFLPSVNTLHPHFKNRDCLLLTVGLSGLGGVAWKGREKAHTVESVSFRSHVYNALIAWFLSLAEPSTSNGKCIAGTDVPFWVAGLQQLWREDGLAIYICAVSHAEIHSHSNKSKRRDVDRSHSVFFQRVRKFLSQVTLRTVVPWLSQLNQMLEQLAHPLHAHLPPASLDSFVSVSPDRQAVTQAFGVSQSFYWQTLETQDQICQRAEALSSLKHPAESVVAVAYRTLFLNPLATHHTLQLILSSGLDVCGIRLLYPSHKLLSDSAVNMPTCERGEHTAQTVLALALRGPRARSVWQDIVGPTDAQLARKTDPTSINALHRRGQEQPLLYSPRLDSRVHRELCKWFGSRAQKNITENHSPAVTDQVDVEDQNNRGSCCLCASVEVDVFLFVSPLVAPCVYSHILSTCATRGFSLLGLQRTQFSSKRAQSLGLSGKQVSAFCHTPTICLDGELLELSSHCLVLLLRRENALHHCVSLPAGLMNEIAVQGLTGSIKARLPDNERIDIDCCFYTAPFSENIFNSLCRFMWKVPDFRGMVLSKHSYPSSPEMEQVVILTLTGQNLMEHGMGLLHRVLRGDTTGGTYEEGFELLALKWLPKLSHQQAQEVTPFEVGDQRWQKSVLDLASAPALVSALRRVNAFVALRKNLPQDYPGNQSVLMSLTPQTAFRQASVFFTERELIADHTARPSLKFLPPPSKNFPGFRSEAFFSCMTEDPLPLFTLCLFKPGVWSHCLGKILSKIQQNGFTVVGLRALLLDRKTATALTHNPQLQEHPEPEARLEYVTSGPSLALCLQRVNAVKRLLELLGPEDPAQARAENQFLWRAQHGTDRLRNGVYGSVSYQRAILDVKMMFPEGLCCTETLLLTQEQIPCLRSDPFASLEREQSHTLASLPKNKPCQSFVMTSGHNRGPLVLSALCQTTCLLMPTNLLRPRHPPLHLDLLEELLMAGCHLVAGRLCTLDESQQRHVSKSLRQSPQCNGINESPLSEGPCLVLALQRDNVVTCFDLILDRICRERPHLNEIKQMFLYPSNETEAKKLLCYLFDSLSSDSHQRIVLPQPTVYQSSMVSV